MRLFNFKAQGRLIWFSRVHLQVHKRLVHRVEDHFIHWFVIEGFTYVHMYVHSVYYRNINSKFNDEWSNLLILIPFGCCLIPRTCRNQLLLDVKLKILTVFFLSATCTVEPWFNEVAGDRPNLFIKSRVRYIEVIVNHWFVTQVTSVEIL